MSTPWTPEEDAKLVAYHQRGELTHKEIGEKLGRTQRAVASRLHRISTSSNELDRPDFHDLYKQLRDNPCTVEELCNKYDRSPAIIEGKLTAMKQEGYAVIKTQGMSTILTGTRPQETFPEVSIADMLGQRLRIGIWSDPHVGGKHSQVTSFNKFIRYANQEYGVEHFFNPGDMFAGIYGYKGQEYDLLPECTPLGKHIAHKAVKRQVWLADKYVPKIPGITHYVLGGNHDWWHVRNTGIDGVRRLCDKRDDLIYLGYDACEVPFTDKMSLLLWHPSGGVAYARSYKLQRKGQEPQAMEELRRAMREDRSPKVKLILSGHDHSVCWLPDLPVPGYMVGCFEGQTSYLTKKGMFPAIGGSIMEFRISDAGNITDQMCHWISFTESEQYTDWPIPEVEELSFDAEQLSMIYEIVATGEEELEEEL